VNNGTEMPPLAGLENSFEKTYYVLKFSKT